MSFNSLQFLVFFPIVVLLYFVIPQKVRYLWLLVASYYFYMCWNAKYALLILFSTVVTYVGALVIDGVKHRKWDEAKIARCKKTALFIGIILNLAVLFFFKYFNFAFMNLNAMFGKVGVHLNQPQFDILLPVGISFYTFQALGYLIDVYREDTYAEKNFFRYALFVSFFPQLVAGPIERSKNLLKQLNTPTCFRVENARYGLFTMAYGLVLKLVIADRIGSVIDPVLQDFESYNGMWILVCMMLFAFQIYCDFHGYTQIAIGSAKVLGFDLSENFRSPYLATNIKEFWRRWHISLTTWFTDYLYIPLGGNRKGKCRKFINVMIVFLCSGLWHGDSWAYVIWGGLNGLYLVLYDLVAPIWSKAIKRWQIDVTAVGYRILGGIGTYILVDYAWIYFRAHGLKTALLYQAKIVKDFYLPYLISNDIFDMFGDTLTVVVLLVAFLFMFITDYLHQKGVDWKAKVLSQQWLYRWIVYMIILFAILLFGVYGTGHEQTQFIYFQF